MGRFAQLNVELAVDHFMTKLPKAVIKIMSIYLLAGPEFARVLLVYAVDA